MINRLSVKSLYRKRLKAVSGKLHLIGKVQTITVMVGISAL
ncbi:hypothetical protein [Stygiolobus sp. CP8521M]